MNSVKTISEISVIRGKFLVSKDVLFLPAVSINEKQFVYCYPIMIRAVQYHFIIICSTAYFFKYYFNKLYKQPRRKLHIQE